jgi:bifunctional non-homologous end joining protein LigD
MAVERSATKRQRASRDRPPARSPLDRIPGARRAPFPGFIEPCHPTLRAHAPADARWLHEIKFDGYRAQAQLRNGKSAIYTRAGHNWTDRFRPIAEALRKLKAQEFVLDGEVVVVDARGIPDFSMLHAALAAGSTEQLLYYVFDLLYLEEFDLRDAPLAERKGCLSTLLAGASERILYAEHLEGEGPEIFKRACAMGLEGIVSKRRDAPYRSGRAETWIKVKCGKRDLFPIIAFVEKLGAKPRKIASLYIGRREGGKVLYAGKVRTGYTEAVARELRERLNPLIQTHSPLSQPVTKPKATWVQPLLSAEIAYGGETENGILRAPVFKGLREDQPPPSHPAVVRSRSRDKQVRTAVPRENILQLLPDAVAPSKDELAAYWKKVWKRALVHLGRRPLKLVRCVNGTIFYHKSRLPPVPAAVHHLVIKKREGGTGVRLWVDSLEGLLGLVEIGAIELHTWNATVDDIEHADMLVFDLDPGAGISWSFVVDTALNLRALLEDEGLQPWPKLTGGKGLHLVAPLSPKRTHDEAHEYAKDLAHRLAASAPERYTLTAAPQRRAGRIFIDYLRNGRGTTAVAAWSPRAKPGFPIAVPVKWRQVEDGIQPDAYNLTRQPRSGSFTTESS